MPLLGRRRQRDDIGDRVLVDIARSTVSTPVSTAAGPRPRQPKSSAMPGALKAPCPGR
jgi:hypothetical protein